MTRISTISGSYAPKNALPRNVSFANVNRAVEKTEKIRKSRLVKANKKRGKEVIDLII